MVGRSDNPVIQNVAWRVKSIVLREEDITLAGRTLQWAAAVDHITSNLRVPIMGVGWGFAGFVLTAGEFGGGNVHCMVLHILGQVNSFIRLGFQILGIWEEQ